MNCLHSFSQLRFVPCISHFQVGSHQSWQTVSCKLSKAHSRLSFQSHVHQWQEILKKSKSLQGTEAEITKTNQRGICVTGESYWFYKVTRMPQVLKGKQAVFIAHLGISPSSRKPHGISVLSPSLKGVVYGVVATPLAHSSQVPNSWGTKEPTVPHSITVVCDPEQMEEAETPEENGKRRIFPDLCEYHGQSLLFLECMAGVWHFYFTFTHINSSNLCIYSGYF